MKNKNFLRLFKLLSLNLLIAAPLFTLAQIKNPIAASSFDELIQKIIDIVIQIGVPIVTLMIIYTGFLFVMAQGNPTKLGKAKEGLTYTLIGAAIVLGSYAIMAIIKGTVATLK